MTPSGERTIVVTGASSGIGLATVKLLASKGARVFGSVRSSEDAARLVEEFGPQVVPLVFDVRDGTAVQSAAMQVKTLLTGRRLSGLVNNVGVAIPGPLLLQPATEFREQIETNLLGVVAVTRAFAPLLGTDASLAGEPGRIVMMSTIGGKIGQPFLGGYVAPKHGLEGLSETLRRELQLFGVEVVIVGPALVDTPIWDKAEPFVGRYAGTPYSDAFDRGVQVMATAGKARGLDPLRVAETVWTALTATRPSLRYAPAQHPVIEQVLARMLPRRLLDELLALGLDLRQTR